MSEVSVLRAGLRLGRRARHWWAWVRQGRRRDVPTVLRVGRLVIHPDGRRVITGWSFDLRRMSSGMSVDNDLWEFLALRYPESIVAPWTAEVL
ncbi:hypothetical protein [Janibacter terrae]|uniref:hypothetical protein n=1 Tax=Janibacter terrae TaxID=103817 RepID=UPI0031F9C26F